MHFAKLIVLTFVFYQCVSCAVGYEPMVAFLCNKPAMYLTEKGWKSDESTDCVKNPIEILNYCKKMFRQLNVTNIVKGGAVEISNWCSYKSSCKKHSTHKVTPYRCLNGPFQSDALLVPDHCSFDHATDATRCLAEDKWASYASLACGQENKVVQSWAMLLPCAVDKFTGVEYVCCPHKKTVETETTETTSSSVTSAVVENNDEERYLGIPTPKTSEGRKLAENEKKYGDYLANKLHTPDVDDEHEHYIIALKAVKAVTRQQLDELMEKWRTELKQLNQIKIEQSAFEDQSRQISDKYQKEYREIEEDEASKKKKLHLIHEKRVQMHFDEKKKNVMANYLEAIRVYDTRQVLQSLQKYIEIEEKDKMHALNHYLHVKQVDAAEATRIHDRVLNHVSLIDKRITESIGMLSSLDKDNAEKIKREIMAFLEAYKAMDKAGEMKILSLPVVATASNEDSDQESQEEYPRTLPKNPVIEDVQVKINTEVIMESPKKSSERISYKIIKHKLEADEEKKDKMDFTFLILFLSVFSLGMLVCTVGYMYLHRVRKQSYKALLSKPIHSNMSPEEYNIYKMQQHGYVNPTWAYLGKKAGSQEPLVA